MWWRACVIWQNKAVNCIGPLLVILTLSKFDIYSAARPAVSLSAVITSSS